MNNMKQYQIPTISVLVYQTENVLQSISGPVKTGDGVPTYNPR